MDLNTPNGPLPVSVTYAPTPGGSTVNYVLSGNMIFNFDWVFRVPDNVAVHCDVGVQYVHGADGR